MDLEAEVANENSEHPGDVHPKSTRRNKYFYFFYEKHHRNGPSEHAQWLDEPELTTAGEFQVFDDADYHEISDDNGNLFGLRRRGDDGCISPLGTRGEQVACFPCTRLSQPWHGYPIWPIEVQRDGERLRPIAKAVLILMVDVQVITQKEKRRLGKGKHI